LRAVAADQGTEVFLVDTGFRRLAEAVGELRVEVAPGLYKVRFRSGDVMADQLVEVPPQLPPGQSEILVRGGPLSFASALPLPDTRTSHEYHQAAWSHAWDGPDLSLGAGSRLFVLARDANKRPEKPSRHVPWQGLSLCGLDGRVLLDFAHAPRRDAVFGFASANLELDPGTYVLRVDTRLNGILEMAVVTRPGWQTQVALRSRTLSRNAMAIREGEAGRGRSVRRADLAGATVLMGRPGYRADLSGQQDRLTELARIGLIQGRATLRPDDLRSLLWAKYENPMLGLYGAHLLLQGGERDLGLLHEVVGNLESLLGDHPDVIALRLALARLDGQAPPSGLRFDAPPMLARGWQLAVEASLEQPDLIPADSFAARIAGNLVNSSPWLIWRRTAELGRALRQGPADLAEREAERVIPNVLKSLQPVLARGPMFGHLGGMDFAVDDLVRDALQDLKASAAERLPSLLEGLAERLPERLTHGLTPIQQALLHEVKATAHLPAGERLGRLTRNLRLPPATLLATLEKLVTPKK
jgi:hypothetical protein